MPPRDTPKDRARRGFNRALETKTIRDISRSSGIPEGRLYGFNNIRGVLGKETVTKLNEWLDENGYGDELPATVREAAPSLLPANAGPLHRVIIPKLLALVETLRDPTVSIELQIDDLSDTVTTIYNSLSAIVAAARKFEDSKSQLPHDTPPRVPHPVRPKNT